MTDVEKSTAVCLLTELVRALDTSHISSWQSAAGWQKELATAREWLVEQSENPP